MNEAKKFLESMKTCTDCHELFKHMILGDYLFKKNIEVYNDSDFEITPKLDEKTENILKTYLSNSIKINGKTIKYDKFNHFYISSFGIIVIKEDKHETKKKFTDVLNELSTSLATKHDIS